jgi:hypothetical protein
VNQQVPKHGVESGSNIRISLPLKPRRIGIYASFFRDSNLPSPRSTGARGARLFYFPGFLEALEDKATMMFRSLSALVVFLILLSTGSAWAWNDLGHITIAEIAWRRLSGDERQAIVKILKEHPHIDTYFKKPDGLAIPEDEWLFMRAATWCDYVRPPKGLDKSQLADHPVYKFHHGPWHYIDYPYQAGQVVAEKLPVALITNDDEKTDILQQLVIARDILTGKTTNDAGQAKGVTAAQNKAVRLCWLFHLVGDLHQPLHTTALVDQKLFPAPNYDDAGGNFTFVRAGSKEKPTNLHSYWDGQLGYITGWKDGKDSGKLTKDVQRCHNQADLLTHAEFAAEKLVELQQHPNYADWADEGFRLATAVVYDGGQLKFACKRDVESNRVPANEVPLLPAAQQEKARETANKRVALAGYRLGDQLRSIAAQ